MSNETLFFVYIFGVGIALILTAVLQDFLASYDRE